MLNLKEFGSRLKLSIKQSPYSQKSICSKLSINKDSLSNYVNGRSLPNTQTLAELCELLNVSSDYLIFGKKSDLFLEKLSSFSTANTDELNNYIDFILYKEKIQNIKQDNQDNIISISKDSEFLKDAMKQQLASTNTAGAQIGDDVKIENIAVKYIVDKNTYLESSSTVSFDFEMQGMKMSMEMDAKMSNINNVTDIVIPKEVLNAKEILHQ